MNVRIVCIEAGYRYNKTVINVVCSACVCSMGHIYTVCIHCIVCMVVIIFFHSVLAIN